MIFITGETHAGVEYSWQAWDKEEFMMAIDETADKVVYEITTARKLAANHGVNIDNPDEDYSDDHEWIFHLSTLHGPDTNLYRADYVMGGANEELYTPDYISKLQAYVAVEECRSKWVEIWSDGMLLSGNS